MKKIALLQTKTDGQAFVTEKESYQGMTGSIMFLMVEIKLNIVFIISIVSRFAKNPKSQHTEAINTIL